MSIFNIFSKKEKKKVGYVFNDSDRALSMEMREKKKEIELLKLERENELHKLRIEKQKLELQQEIDELKGLYDEEEPSISEDNMTSDLIKMFAPMLVNQIKHQSPNSSPLNINQTTTSNPSISLKSISDEELLALWNETPQKYKDYAKTMSDENVLKTLQNHTPGCDVDTYSRALKIVRQS